jgi:hypothetical protein
MPQKSWTGYKDVIHNLERLWDSGKILSSAITGREIFPLSIPVKGPSSAELGEMYGEAREWAKSLTLDSERSGRYRVVKRTVNHRILGRNELPDRICVNSADDAISLLRKKREMSLFGKITDFTYEVCPPLISYLERHPLEALELENDWEKCVLVSTWIMLHPKPDIYVRQMDIPGIDTKFMERHKGLISRLLDILLPHDAISGEARGVKNFEARYGFKIEPILVRCRLPLDCPAFPRTVSDISLPSEEFASLDLGFDENWSAIFIENKINFLAIPRAKNLLIVWAKGYGFDSLKDARWLNSGKIYYWGDIDTHGFAILNQFRSVFRDAESILMDRHTLMEHRDLWVEETAPTAANLPNLTAEESDLYRDLYENSLGMRIRMEQERLSYALVTDALWDLSD